MRILFVEDDADACKAVLRIFENARDRQIVIAHNGAEAWWHLSRDPESFDLLVIDLNMPVVGGFDLLNRVRQDASMQELPVILMSGGSDRETLMRAASLRVNGFLVKPFDHAALTQKVDEIDARRLVA